VIKTVVAIMISPCISTATIDPDLHITVIQSCPDTVKIETRDVVKQYSYADYQHNFFRLRKVMFDKEAKIVLK